MKQSSDNDNSPIPTTAPIPVYLTDKERYKEFLRDVFLGDTRKYEAIPLYGVLVDVLKYVVKKRNAVVSSREDTTLFSSDQRIRNLMELFVLLKVKGYATVHKDDDNGAITVYFHESAPSHDAEPEETVDDSVTLISRCRELIIRIALSAPSTLITREDCLEHSAVREIDSTIFTPAFNSLVTPAESLPVLLPMKNRDGNPAGFALRCALPYTFFERIYESERSRLFELLSDEALRSGAKTLPAVVVPESKVDTLAVQYLRYLCTYAAQYPSVAEMRTNAFPLPIADEKREHAFMLTDTFLKKTLELISFMRTDKAGVVQFNYAELFKITPEQIAKELKKRSGGMLSSFVFKQYLARISAARTSSGVDNALSSTIMLVFSRKNLNRYQNDSLERFAYERKEKIKTARPEPLGMRLAPSARTQTQAPATATAFVEAGVPIDRVCRAVGLKDSIPKTAAQLEEYIAGAQNDWYELSKLRASERDTLIAAIQKSMNSVKKSNRQSREDIQQVYQNVSTRVTNTMERDAYNRLVRYLFIKTLCTLP
ncbi:MAG: hypothetical protein HZC28_06310 [Spirochaetes bacterium]|nr:hypothetical protein [Spirochaetota bacterium]